MKRQSRVLYIYLVGACCSGVAYSTACATESFLSGKMHMCNSLVRHADLKPQCFDHI